MGWAVRRGHKKREEKLSEKKLRRKVCFTLQVLEPRAQHTGHTGGGAREGVRRPKTGIA